ncbi:MAG TPA: TatD family hydrolase [Polyangiaceae bacterium]|nr:TatD family hydrolase [Polyangiaceae bacterium]
MTPDSELQQGALVDVHAHLTHPRLLEDVESIIERARAAGVAHIVCNGLNPEDNQRVLELAERFAIVHPGLGFYPVDTVITEMRALNVEYPREGEEFTAEQGVAWLEANVERAFAVGEIGLDGHWVPEALWDQQEQVFRRLVRLAMEADKPIIIHTRRRERRALEILDELGAPRVDWHCFGGKVNLARQIAERPGHYLSIPANARRSESFTRMLTTLPRDRLLLETDCPYLSPDKQRPSEPADVASTAAYAAELWNVPLAEVERTIADNFARLFAL